MAIVEKEKFPSSLQELLRTTPSKHIPDRYPKKDVVLVKTIYATSGGRPAKRRAAKKAGIPWKYYREIAEYL